MIRFKIEAHCDAPGCGRFTDATADARIGVTSGGGTELQLEYIEFGAETGLVVPAVNPPPKSQWVERDGLVWCPEHGRAAE